MEDVQRSPLPKAQLTTQFKDFERVTGTYLTMAFGITTQVACLTLQALSKLSCRLAVALLFGLMLIDSTSNLSRSYRG